MSLLPPFSVFIIMLVLSVAGLFVLLINGRQRHQQWLVPLIAIVLLVLTLFYVVSFVFTGVGIDHSVIYHLRVGLRGAGYWEYAGLAMLCFVAMVLGILVIVRLTRFVLGLHVARSRWLSMAASLSLLASVAAHPATVDLSRLYSSWTTSGELAFSDTYQPPPPLDAPTRKRNLLMIYLESYEFAYLDETLFPGLSPGLRRLQADGLTLTEVNQVTGADWTIAGMVSSQCGIPLEIPIDWANIWEAESFLSKASCMGDLLKQQGYQLTYMGGAALSFGNKGLFYKTHKFDEVLGKSHLKQKLPDSSYQSSWGLYDDSLFDLAYKKYTQLLQDESPFALVMLTVDTHFPEGHIAASCKDRPYAASDDAMLQAIHCSDYLVAKFVDKVRRLPQSENTLIVLLSDHIGKTHPPRQKVKTEQRRVFYTALSGEFTSGTRVKRPATHFDLGPTTLGLMGFEIETLGLGVNLMDEAAQSLGERIHDPNAQATAWLRDAAAFW